MGVSLGRTFEVAALPDLERNRGEAVEVRMSFCERMLKVHSVIAV